MSEETTDDEQLVKIITKTTKKREIIDKKSYSKWSNTKETLIGKDDVGNKANIKQHHQKRNEKKRDNKKEMKRVKKKRKKDKESKVLVSSSSTQENGSPSEDSSYNLDPLMLTYDGEDSKEKKRKNRKSLNSDSDYENPIPSKKGKALLNKHMKNLIRAAIRSGKFENKAGKVTKQECNSIRTRSSPKSLLTALQSLNDDQKQAVRDIGFGSILELSLHKIPSKIGYFVVDRFDERTLKIRLESCYIQIDKQVVHDMLGVPLGGLIIKKEKISKGDDEVTKEWRKRIGMEKEHVRPSHVVEAIKNSPDAGRNFILNFLVLFNTCMAENTIMGCNLKFLPYVKEDVDIRHIDWCQYIIDCLKVSKVYWDREDDKSFYTGPLALLVLFYVDSTKCSRFQVIRTRPALKAWTSDLLKKREDAEISSGGFGRGEVEIPFKDEQKKALPSIEKNDDKFENFVKDQEGRKNNIHDHESRAERDCHSHDTNVEEYINNIKALFAHIVTEKERLDNSLVDSSSRFPDHEQLQHYEKLVKEFFGQSTNTKTKSERKLPQLVGDGTYNLEESSDFSETFLRQVDDTVAGIIGKTNEDVATRHYSDTFINQNDDLFEGPSFNLNVTQEMEKSLQDNVEQEEVCDKIPEKLVVRLKVSHKKKESEKGRKDKVQVMPTSALMPSETYPTTPIANFAIINSNY